MAKGKELLTDGRLAILLVIVILIIDQVIKIEVKTSMSLGEAIHVTDWFYIDFVDWWLLSLSPATFGRW